MLTALLSGALGGALAALAIRAVERWRSRRELARLVAETERHIEDTARMLADSRARVLAALSRAAGAKRSEIGH